MQVFVEFQPFLDRVSKSGILLGTPKHEGVPDKGYILALDKRIKHLKVGDYVLYNEHSPKGFEYEDKKIIPVHVDNVVAILTEKEKV